MITHALQSLLTQPVLFWKSSNILFIFPDSTSKALANFRALIYILLWPIRSLPLCLLLSDLFYPFLSFHFCIQ